jgi:hypothetical protein
VQATNPEHLVSLENHCYLWGVIVWPLLHGLQEHVYSLVQIALLHSKTSQVEETSDSGRMMRTGIP